MLNKKQNPEESIATLTRPGCSNDSFLAWLSEQPDRSSVASGQSASFLSCQSPAPFEGQALKKGVYKSDEGRKNQTQDTAQFLLMRDRTERKP